MTATTGTDNGRDDRAELARLLPPATGFALPPGRHEHHRERLMNQIDHDTAAAAARDRAPDRASTRAQGGTPGRTSGRPQAPARPRLLRPSFLAPVAALALAGALVAGYSAQGGGEGPARAGGGASAPERAGDAQPVALVLGRISDAAAKSGAGPVGDDQFVYVRSQVQAGDLTSGKLVTGPPTEREIWYAQQPGPQKKLGFIRQDGETLPINAELGDAEGTREGLHRPTYRWLAALPTDPRQLLDHLTALTPKDEGQEHAQAVFENIGHLIGETVLPPETAAALYRAAALIPGVTEAPDAVDALGRHGVGIAREDTRHATRSEWVFDPEGLAFLGSRTFLTKDTEIGGKGALLDAEAVLKRSVVDEGGVRPQG
ncbi:MULTISPECIES: CU044_5270 family protein [unclassified Streptomyces]|uniref:CU044_5270 family protein n=1 Tax=unclassified Streptomyces TaxID=2593676 RepID=UPI00345031EF